MRPHSIPFMKLYVDLFIQIHDQEESRLLIERFLAADTLTDDVRTHLNSILSTQ